MPADVLARSEPLDSASIAASVPWTQRLRAYHELAKPNLTFLVLLTGVFGYYLGTDGFDGLRPARLMAFVLGTALTAGGACALNMYIERTVDGRMRRTAKRPLPSGRVPAHRARWFATLSVLGGSALLWAGCGLLPAGLGLATAGLYGFIYTPLKRVHGPLSVVVGAVPGAVPPVMGWAAVQGGIGWEGLALFAIVFAWQFPHFLALAYLYRQDYARGGFRFLPGSDRTTSRLIFLGTVGLLITSLAPVALGLAETVYLVGATAAGLAFVGYAARTLRRLDGKSARAVFLASITYLPVLLGLILVDGLLR